jgi:hypothetical protein
MLLPVIFNLAGPYASKTFLVLYEANYVALTKKFSTGENNR